MNLRALLARRTLLGLAVMGVGILIGGCGGGSSSSSMPAVSQGGSGGTSLPTDAVGSGVIFNPNGTVTERTLGSGTVTGPGAVGLNYHVHAMAVAGHAPFRIARNRPSPFNTTCPPVNMNDLCWHGGPILFNTGSFNVFVNDSPNGSPNHGHPGGFLGRMSLSSLNHYNNQYDVVMGGGATRDNRYPFLGNLFVTDNNISPNGVGNKAGSDATITAELQAAAHQVDMIMAFHNAGLVTGYRVAYNLFYVQNQAICSVSVGGCYLNNPFVFCAFHGSQDLVGSPAGHVIFSVEPWQQIGGCTAPTDNIQNDTSSTLSHEVQEFQTDPDVAFNPAWFRDMDGQENGDICRTAYGHIIMNPGAIDYNIQKEYDNSIHACSYGPGP